MTTIRIVGSNAERQRYVPCRFYITCALLAGFMALLGTAALAAGTIMRTEARLAAEARV